MTPIFLFSGSSSSVIWDEDVCGERGTVVLQIELVEPNFREVRQFDSSTEAWYSGLKTLPIDGFIKQ